MRHASAIKVLLSLCVGFASVLLEVPAWADQTLPSVQVGSLSTPIDPTTAYSYYSGVGLTSNARTVTNDPEIVELARALHNDPDLIYEWVRNNVEIELRFGLAKGARGAAIDKSGTAFDQAHLMVELLRASGITATYQFGTITLTGQQFTDWTGISNADAANAILASGGIPATVNGTGSSITSVTLMHLWLKATIGGTQYSFDPAYKPHTFKTGINVGTAMGFNGSTFVSDALSGSTSDTNSSIPKLRRVNLANVASDLTSYAQTLLTYLKTNMPNAELDDVIGGQRITRYTGGALRQTSLPYSSSVMTTFSNDVPNVLRTTYRIRNGSLDKTLYVDEFYGCVLSYGRPPQFGDTGPVPLNCDDHVLVPNLSGMLSSTDFTIDIDHPYAANSGTYMDVSSVQRAGGSDTSTGGVIFVYGFGNTSAQFGARIDERTGGWRQTYSTVSGNFSSEEGPTYTAMDDGAGGRTKSWTGWLAQYARMAEFYSRLGGVFHLHHHSLGVIANLYQSAGDDGDLANPCLKINIESGISLESKTADTSGRRAALSALVSGMETLEGSVNEQVNGTTAPVSVASKLDWVNRVTLGSDGGTNDDWVYLVNSSNWSSVDALLLSDSYYSVFNATNNTYSDAYRKLVETQAAAYIAAGYTLIIPRSSNLGPGAERTVTSRNTICDEGGSNQCVHYPVESAGPDRGGVIIAFKSDDSSIAYIVVRSSTSDKGGGGKVELDPSKVFSPSDNWQEQQYETKARSYSADLQTGAMTYTAPADLVAGNGDFPYSLPFQRTFRAGFGQGWQHNWQSDLTVAGSGMAAMSDTNPQAAAETIAALFTQLYLTPQTQSTDLAKLQRHVVAATVNMWWAEKTAFNTATVSAGPKQWSFTRLADNTFAAPPGDATVLTVPTGITKRQFGGNGGAWYTLPQTLAPVAAQGQPKSPAGDGAQGTSQKDCTSYGTLSDYRITMREKDQTLWTYDFMCADIGTWDRWTNAKPQVGKTGYRLQTIAFPYGVNVTLTYASNELGFTGKAGTFYLTRVENNLGRSLKFDYSNDDGSLTNGDAQQRFIDPIVSDTTNGGTGRAVHITGYFCDTDYNNPEAGELTPLCQGTINSITDPLGHATRYATTAVVAPGTNIYGNPTYTLNGNDSYPWPLPQHIAQIFYPTDTTTPSFAYGYDSFGRLKTASDALADQWQYRIANGRRGDVTDATGGNSATVYDTRDLAIQEIDALGNVTTTDYDSLRRKSKVMEPEGNSEEYVYDAKSNVTQTTKHAKPGSSLSDIVTSTTYDSTCNVPLTQTDALSRVTTNTISTTTCLILTTTGPAVGGSSPVTTTAYDSVGHVTSITDPTGLVTTYSYNSTTGNFESAIVDPGTSPHVAATTVFAYDTFDNITSITDPRGNVHTATYDLSRRLTQHAGPTSTGAVTKWTYNDDGFITKIERATSDTGNPWAATNYAYWPTGQLKTMTDADGQVTRYDYDAANRLQITTDPENRRAFTQYDLKGQTTKEIRAYLTPRQEDYATYTYSANGKRLSVADARSNTTTYAYDGFDRPIRSTFADSTYEASTYDAKGNQLTKLNRAGVTLTFTFDALDRMATKVMPLLGGGNLTTTWTYDLGSRVTDLADSAGYDLAYAFDTAKRITSVTRTVPGLSGTQVVAYQYDTGGNKTRVTWPDSYYVQYQFDALGRMTTASENGTYLLATYTYDKLGRRASLVYGNGAYTTYSYTQQGDLTSLAHNWLTSGGAATGNTFTHTFTLAHQLASVSASDTTHLWDPAVYQTNAYATANNLNQYGQVTLGSNAASTLTYDASGNMTSDGALTMTYDAENRLLAASKSGMSAVYGYDPMGRRAKAVVNSTTTLFLDSENEEIGDYDASGALLRRYIAGPGTDQPIAMIGTGSAPTRDYFHVDRVGTTVAVTDNGDHVSQGPFTYDAYGQSSQTGGVPFRFTGRRLDPETGLYYYRARYYSTALGRFLQTDPVGYKDQINLYGYAHDDPANVIDPSGLLSHCEMANGCDAVLAQEKAAVATAKDIRSDIAKAKSGDKEAQARLNAAFQRAFGTDATNDAMARVDAVLAAGIRASDQGTYTYRDATNWGPSARGAVTDSRPYASKTIWVGMGNSVAWKGSPSLADHELFGHGGMAGAGVRDIKDGNSHPLPGGGYLDPYSIRQMRQYPDMATRNASDYECLIGGQNCGT